MFVRVWKKVVRIVRKCPGAWVVITDCALVHTVLSIRRSQPVGFAFITASGVRSRRRRCCRRSVFRVHTVACTSLYSSQNTSPSRHRCHLRLHAALAHCASLCCGIIAVVCDYISKCVCVPSATAESPTSRCKPTANKFRLRSAQCCRFG